MAQKSGPISQGTLAERQFDDVLWRDIHGAEPGVIGDLDGSAYALTLPTNSDIVQVGSTTQPSLALVAGFRHRINAEETEGVEIPTASGTARTDIIALRYDPEFTGLPGPVRLVRIAGTSSGLPTHDASPPGVEDMPLWGITRQPGQALSQATTQRLFSRLAPSLEIPVGAPLPTSSPLGTVLRQGRISYRRELGNAGVPAWVSDGVPVLSSIDARNAYFSGNLRAGVSALVAGNLHVYDGAAWRFTLTGTISGATSALGWVIFPHGAGQVPTSWGCSPSAQISDAIGLIVHGLADTADATNLWIRAVRTDQNAWFASNPVTFHWWAKF